MKRRPTHVCVKCGGLHRVYTSRCPSCGALFALIMMERAIDRGIPLPVGVLGPTRVARLSTGLAPLFWAAASLRARSRSSRGPQGSGKTTLATQAAGHVERSRDALVASWEMDLEATADMMARLGLAGRSRLRPLTPAGLAEFVKLVERTRPAVAVVDSVPECAEASRIAEPVVIKRLHELSHRSRTAILAVLHLNAKGMIAGPRRSQYRGDATLVVPSTSGGARRVQAIGLDRDRVAMLVAIVERAGVRLPPGDVTVSVPDGGATRDLATDAAIVAVVVSAARETPSPRDAAYSGEIGLGAELRRGRNADLREAEARRLELRIIGEPGRSLIDAMGKAHLCAV